MLEAQIFKGFLKLLKEKKKILLKRELLFGTNILQNTIIFQLEHISIILCSMLYDELLSVKYTFIFTLSCKHEGGGK